MINNYSSYCVFVCLRVSFFLFFFVHPLPVTDNNLEWTRHRTEEVLVLRADLQKITHHYRPSVVPAIRFYFSPVLELIDTTTTTNEDYYYYFRVC